MKFSIIFFLILSSCANYGNYDKKNFIYSAKGFAYVEKSIPLNEKDDNFYISHNSLKPGTKIRITNPENQEFLISAIKKGVKYDNFYKVLISTNVAKTLKLNFNFPYVEINEIKKNKSFIAKKAVTDNAEKKIANNAPIEKININNLAKKKKLFLFKKKTYSILVAEFYSFQSAKLLKERLTSILASSNYRLIYIDRKSDKSYELLLGPYNTIKKLKNDYNILSDSDFEDLDIKIND